MESSDRPNPGLCKFRRLGRPLWLAALVALAFVADPWIDASISGPVASGQVKATLASLRAWGEAPILAGLLAAMFLLQPGNWRVSVAIGLATTLAAFAAELIKPSTSRLRPVEVRERGLDGAWHFGPGRNSSFPSGHVATAVAFAHGASTAHPALKPLALLAATGTAISRMRDGRHYLSDCIAGAVLGWFVSSFALAALAGWTARPVARTVGEPRRVRAGDSSSAATAA